MPHKHTRLRDNDKANYNLPPTEKARPLSVGKAGQTVFTSTDDTRKAKSKRKRKDNDDTPKAFARMMAWQESNGPRPSGLDNGDRKKSATTSNKKRKLTDKATTTPAKPAPAKAATAEVPKILPGESLRAFAVRVDQALPVAGLTRKTNKNLGDDIPALRERRTKTEKRLHKMYAEWRVEETRRQEARDEARELEEELKDEEEVENGGRGGLERVKYEPEPGEEEESKGKKKRKRRLVGEIEGKDDDPWAELKEKRDKPKGLHDVVLAPPDIKVVPKEKFKMRNGAGARVADVPSAAGSLARREELGQERLAIIERYRAMMGRK